MTPAGQPSRAGPSIRRLLASLLGTVAVLVAALILVTSLQIRGSNRTTEAENRRTESFLVADSMRQSSDDLTRMVRLYVSTGEPRYRDYYDEILAIRSGEAPRPQDYDSRFWDRVLAEGKDSVVDGPAESIVDQMRAASFASEEFEALNASLRASDELAEVELDVMERVADRIALGVDDSYFTDVGPDYRRLVDDAYMVEKGRIMAAIGEFIDLVDQRTLAEVAGVRATSRRLFGVQLGILAGVVIVGVRAAFVMRRLVLRPLDTITKATNQIAEGNYAQRTEVEGVSELGRVAGAFNAMAAAVDADVAARERAEQVAVEATRAKSSFLASMSHEIRTPMIGVTGMLEVLAQTDLTREQRQMVATAQSSATALLQIIGDTLDFSKIEAGKLEIAATTFVVRDVVEAATATFRHTASAKGLRLEATCDQALAPAHVGDPLRIRQVVSNFVSNAVKFTDVGGIEVSARVLDPSTEGSQSIELAVIDTGVGITEEQRRRLFEEFSQAEASTAQRYGGTGLGLVICQRLASLMGGAVTMDSHVGHGTTMRLVLSLPTGDPADVVPETRFLSTRFQESRPTPTRDAAIREGSLVLLAEDHSVNRAVILQQLDVIGLCAEAAYDGREALERFATGDFSIVLTDVHMPGLDGYELAGEIRRLEAERGWPRTPIMALTADVMHGEPERCRQAGMDDFAGKPTTIGLLAAKLRQWLPGVPFPSLDDDRPQIEGAGGGDDGNDRALDVSVLHELTGGDRELAADVLRDFVTSTAADLERLGQAVEGHDLEGVRRSAHRIKGASLVVGAKQVAALADRLESDAADGCDDTLGALRNELAAAFAVVANEVDTRVDR